MICNSFRAFSPNLRASPAKICCLQSAKLSSSLASPESIKSVGILGAGQMGIGIAFVSALRAKVPTVVIDKDKSQVEKQFKFLESLLNKDVRKEKITAEDGDSALSRLSYGTDMEQLCNTDMVIEAVSENQDLKRSIFAELGRLTKTDAILATNTSSISITKIAAATLDEERAKNVIGMHFMNPVPVMKLVEIIPGLQTSPQTLTKTQKMAEAMGKVTTTSQDMPGFIANRLLMPYINEAVYAFQEGIGSLRDIDTTMKLGTNMPMGPLTLADFIGLDTCLAIMQVLHTQLGDTKYRPAPLLTKYVDAGWLGKKSGRGFYTY